MGGKTAGRRSFDDPILPHSPTAACSERGATQSITSPDYPKADQAKPHWRTAAHELMTVAAARGGIVMLRRSPTAGRKLRRHFDPLP
jgi:hypothetical protein